MCCLRCFCALIVLCLGSAVYGQSWNRSVDAIAVVPSDSAIPNAHHVYVAVRADDGGAGIPLDLSMSVDLFNGSSLVGSVLFDNLNSSPVADTGGGPCGMPCPLGQTCYCQGLPPDCNCGSWIKTPEFNDVILAPGDVLTAVLTPLATSDSELDTSDDSRSLTYTGLESKWNRRIAGLTIEPTSTPGTHLVTATVEVETNAASAGAGISLDMDLLVNVGGSFAATEHILLSAQGDGMGPCGMTCPLGEVCHCYDLPPRCVCAAWIQDIEIEVEVLPGEIVEVILRPIPGALPELPGFGDDDEEDETVPQGLPCRGDCAPDNGDGTFGNGVINIDDLLKLINDFGTCPTTGCPCDSAPDNGDGTFGNGVINIDDLLYAINNFGVCFPV
ncbi:MAG: hypothetical protein AAF432_13905 [Planctomycetota bacterium]